VKEEQQKEKARKQAERKRVEELRRKRKEERIAKQKLLSKKTRKGQPIMSGRIELLVSKIEADLGYKPRS
jgi:hypothetical protein